MRIGIAADHGGFLLKEQLSAMLRERGHEIMDFGAHQKNNEDDYPDYVIPLAEGVAEGTVERGIAVCGSGVGACIAANKVPGVRAALVNDSFSAHQGVQDDDMNIICIGGRVTGPALAGDMVRLFLASRFTGADRHKRRLAKIAAVEQKTTAHETAAAPLPAGGVTPHEEAI